MLNHHEALLNAEMAAEKLVARSQMFLPVTLKFLFLFLGESDEINLSQVIARLCLVSTFLEDGLRMISQWSEQQDYVNQVLYHVFL